MGVAINDHGVLLSFNNVIIVQIELCAKYALCGGVSFPKDTIAKGRSGIMGESESRLPQCPMDLALNIIDGKWKIHILWNLNRQTTRFNELQRLLPHITQKILTQQLRQLEQDGLVQRQVYAEVPPRVEYSLTEWGRKLQPVFETLCQWGSDYQQHLASTPGGTAKR
jgi:DNA-binding HxlR family transcriptional regulator